jgi:ParB family chromosome partitioning protein
MSARYLSDVAGATAQHCWETLADGNLGKHFSGIACCHGLRVAATHSARCALSENYDTHQPVRTGSCRLPCGRCSGSLSRMATSPAKSGLGKGLGALIGNRPAPRPDVERGEKVHQVDLTSISPSRLQPRKEFAPDALHELVDSIRQHGIIQPLIVRQIDGRHELIAGERRWRAAQEAGLTQVPVIVRIATDLEVLELSLIENLQRTDLNPIEEAQGYARLAGEFGLRQEDIALKVGRSRAAVANSMRLLDLHPQIQVWLTQDLLSVGHAKVLLALKALEEQLIVAEAVLRRSATVRGTERLVARQLGIGRVRRKLRAGGASVSSAAIEDLQNRLQQHLGTRVTLHHGEKRGRIEIEYYGDEDLQRIVTALGLTTSES